MPLKRKTQFLFKIETSEGQDAVPTGSDAIRAFDLELSDGPEQIERANTGSSLSPEFALIGRDTAQATFKTEFRGSGDTTIPVDLPDFANLITCAGYRSVAPVALTVPAPTGNGIQLGEVVQQSAGAIRGVVVGLFTGGLPVERLRGAAGSIVVAPLVGTFTAAATTGESSGVAVTASAVAAYPGIVYRTASQKLVRITTAAACAAALGEVVTIEQPSGTVVGSMQILINNGAFTDVEGTLLYGTVANGNTVRAAAGGTTTINAAPTQTETPSGTAQFNEDGEQFKLTGSRLDWTLGGVVGEPWQFEWTLRGDPGPTTNAVPPAAGSFGSIVGPQMLGSLLCYGRGAETYRLPTKEVRIAAGNSVAPNLDGNRDGGSTGSNITARVPEITATVDRVHSTFPWRDVVKNATPVRFAALLGRTPGNIMGVIAPRCQATVAARGDADGINTQQVTLRPALIQAAGNDELFIVQL